MVESAKLKTITHVYKFNGKHQEIYQLLRTGASINEIKHKYHDDFYEKKTVYGNVFLREGINYLWRLAMAQSGLTPFNSSNCHLGVGNGTTPASSDQTGLQGTQKFYKLVDSGYPKVEATSFIARATFGSGEANFAWNEWTVSNGNSDDAINLNRKVESLGTKSSPSIWALEVELIIE